ncbi:MAG: histidine kinase [Acidimicrobiales bacterium]|nr:histidine kinase [Acidimicrobiales bacterium]
MQDPRARAEVWSAVGVLAALALAGMLASAAGDLGQVNVALLLVLLVAAIGAAGGRTPGAATGAVAACSYTFFHTEPVHSLRIEHPQDALTVALLALVGLVVGELARRWRESQRDATRSDTGLSRVFRVAELAASGVDIDTLVSAVEQEIRLELQLAEVRFDLGGLAGEDRAVLAHDGAVDEPVHVFLGDDFALPPAGVDLAVVYRGRDFGRLVLRPGLPVGVAPEQRRCAVALADQLGAALATTMVP